MTEDIPVIDCTALDIDHEHWTMRAVPCGCGGAWVKGAQALTDGPAAEAGAASAGGPCDEWHVQCAACGARARFRFDISGFFAHTDRVAEWVAQQLPGVDERTQGRIVRKIGPAFGTRFRRTLTRLVSQGDLLTLLYLHAQVTRAIEAVRYEDADGSSGERMSTE